MKNKKLLIFFLGIIILISASHVYAKVRYDGIDLNPDGRILYTSVRHVPGVPDYKSLYCARLGEERINGIPEILTCFPERMELLCDEKVLQIRNMNGISRFSIDDGKIMHITENSRLSKSYARTYPVSVSCDGKWYCCVERAKNATGRLVLVNSKTMLRKILVENVDIDYSDIRVKWSPDGKAILYENNNAVYFATPDAVFKNLQINETFRKIGDGTIESVQWTQDRKIIYLKNDIVYKIEQNELYTRGLYSTLVGSGEIIGRLPVSFDGIRDKFWCNSNGSKIAVISNGNILSLYSMNQKEKNDYIKIDMIYTLTEMSGTCLGHRIFWNGDKPVLWVDSLDYESNEKTSNIYAIEEELNYIFQAKNTIEPVVSSDFKKIAYTDNGTLRIFDISNMTETASYSDDDVVSVAWCGKNSLYAGGKNTISRFNIITRDVERVLVSSVEKAYWESGMVIAKSADGKTTYCYDTENKTWKNYELPEIVLNANDRNGNFRVFLSEAANTDYENTILVRYLSGKALTYSVFPESLKNEKKNNRVALVFDALENSEGLGNVLYILSEFGIKGTFFLNGEFIRRYPQKTQLIANSRNECASMFYTTADLVAGNFVIDDSFITRGLARNEDEFFAATKKELSLMWHAPEYHDNEIIRNAGKSAGYQYVSAFSGINDKVTYEISAKTDVEYKSASELIDLITEELHDGMIIPVSIGKTSGTRKDYLYEKLDLLISAILDKGYEITDVRGLKQ